MAKVRIEMNIPGFNEFRKQPAIVDELVARGNKIAAAAGGPPDFTVEVTPGMRTRARVTVGAATTAGRRKEAVDRVLTRALEAGRG